MEQNATATVPVMDSGKQDSGKGWKIATAIVSVVAVCGIGFGVYGMLQSSQKDNQTSDLEVQVEEDNKTATTNETSDISFKEVKELLKNVVNFDYNVTSTDNNLFKNGLTEQYKYYLSLKKLGYTDRISVTHDDGGMPGGNLADYEYDFTYDDINNAYHSLFGSDSDVQNQKDFWCFVPFYSEDYGKYISISRCGGIDPSTYAYEILDYSTNDDELTVDVAYLYVSPTGDNGAKYIALDGTNKDIYEEKADLLLEYEDELPKYKLTFKKEGDNYIFTKISKI